MKKRENNRIIPKRFDSEGNPYCLIPACNEVPMRYANGRFTNYCKNHSFWDMREFTNWGCLRDKVLFRDNFTCKKCGNKFPANRLVADHIIPIACGGDEWDKDNIQTLCKDCNKTKTRFDMGKIALVRRNDKYKSVINSKQVRINWNKFI